MSDLTKEEKEKLEKEEKERKEKEDKAKKDKEEKELKVFTEVKDAVQAIRDKYTSIEKTASTQGIVQTEIKETIEKVTKKIDEMEITQKKFNVAMVDTKDETSPTFKAFINWTRKSEAIPEEFKVMRISDQTLGGYLASPEITNELLKDVVEYSPMRPLVRVRTTSKESVKIRKRTGVFAAQWTGEVETKTETTGLTYGMEELPTHELYAFVDVSNWDLEDSDFNMEGELRLEFSEQFGVAEGTAIISGNSVKKPEGILANASVGHVPSGDANLLKADGFKTCYFAPKSVYAKKAKWLMARATMLAASILKTGTGVYLLKQLQGAPAWNIMGSEVVECVDMPAVAAGAFPVAFGDWKKAYILADRIAMAILRDPYTQAATNSVRFHARKRLGGQIVKPEACHKLEIAAA